MTNRPVELLLGRPKTALFITAVVVLSLAYFIRYFEIDASADTLLTRDNPHYIETKVVNGRFASQEFMLVAYAPDSGDVLSEQTFSVLGELSRRLKSVERVTAVRSILNVPLLSLADGGLASPADASELTIERGQTDIGQLKALFRGHPIYEGLLINGDQSVTAIQLLFERNAELVALDARITELRRQSLEARLGEAQEHELESLEVQTAPLAKELDQARRKEIETIRGIVAEFDDNAEIYLGGLHVLAYQLVSIVSNDMWVFGGGIAVVICVLLFLMFRRLRWVGVSMLCCVSSIAATLGLFGLLGFKVTVISASFVSLQLILTLAIVVHLIVQYFELAAEHSDWQQSQLLAEAVSLKFKPCVFATLTTSVGFVSLLFSNLQPVISFGWMMTVAVTVSLLVSLTIFPSFLALFERQEPAARRPVIGAILDRTHCVQRYPSGLILTSAALVLMSIAGLLRLSVENSFLDYFRATTDVHRELSFIDRELGGSTPLDIVIDLPENPPDPELVMSAGTVQTLQKLDYLLEKRAAVGHVMSVFNFTELAKIMNDNKPLTEYELTAIYRTLDADLRDDLLGGFFNVDKQQARMAVRIKDSTDELDRQALLQGIRSDLEESGVNSDSYTLTNLFVLYQDILDRLFRSQVTTVGFVLVALTLTFWILFGSLRIALVAIVPNIFVTVLTFGVMGWLSIPLDLMTITIAAIAMGIAVDDTIHYIHRYRRESRQAGHADDAIRRTQYSVGVAIVFTSLIIAIGFLCFVLSDFVPSILFGSLTAFAMIVAMLADLCLLPTLLRKFVPPEPGQDDVRNQEAAVATP